jgi:Cysteine-rich CPXCG
MKKPIPPAIHPSSFILCRQGYVRRFGAKMKDEASYNCDSCGEEIVVPIDLTAGSSQEYVEDCPVCCRPNVIHVEIDDAGDVRVWAERE